jgi:hypothetical protein
LVIFCDNQIVRPDFQDVHGTLLIGFGFLVAFLRRYGFGSITMNMMITAFTLELAVSKILIFFIKLIFILKLLVRGFLTDEFALYGKFYVNLQK